MSATNELRDVTRIGAAHTPTPWCPMYDGTVIRGFDGTNVASDVKSFDDALRICRAVNSHDALVAALREIAAVEPAEGKAARNRGAMLQMQAIARAALAKAEG
jgi:dihydroxyacetone kinase